MYHHKTTSFFQRAILLVTVITLCRACFTTVAYATDGEKKMVVIVADRTGLSDWSGEGIKNIMARGAVGLMVTRTEDPGNAPAAYATLGAGLPASEHENGSLAFGASELYDRRRAFSVFNLRTGKPAPRGSIVHLGIGPIRSVNETSRWSARPGALGSLLKEAGYKTAVLGNGDYGNISNRNGALIAMDEDGIVDGGDISRRMLKQDILEPWSLKTNTPLLIKKFKEVLPDYDFIVIDFGDTSRAESFREYATPAAYSTVLSNAIKRFESLLASVISTVDLSTTQVVVVSPTPKNEASRRKEKLTPILALGAGIEGVPGLLSSASTRRKGIVLNTDFAPHVCNFFGIQPASDFIGSPFTTIPAPTATEFITILHDRDAFVESRSYLLQNIIIWHLFVLLVCFITSLRITAAALWWNKFLTSVILFTVTLFLSFLYIAGLPQANTPLLFPATLFGICLIIFTAASLIPATEHKMIFLSSVYLLSITLDQLAGGPLISNSVLGYYPQYGARFYGIGNEFMGFMISAPIVIVGLLLDLKRNNQRFIKIISFILIAGTVFVVGSPTLGANFGGLVSCSVAAIVMGILVFKEKINWKTITWALIALAVIITCFVLVDAFVLGGKTHVGELASRMLHGGGVSEFTKVVGRKVAVNIRLLRVSFWSALFICSAAIAVAVHYFPIARLKLLFNRHKSFHKAYIASFCGALAAFAINDSGIVPGATSFILPTATLFLLLFNQPEPGDAEVFRESDT